MNATKCGWLNVNVTQDGIVDQQPTLSLLKVISEFPTANVLLLFQVHAEKEFFMENTSVANVS